MEEGVGDAGTRSASTSSAELDDRWDRTCSSSPGECKRRRGSTSATIEAEGPLIFWEKSGESGSSTCGGVLAGEDRAFISEKARSSSSSSTSDRLSVKGDKLSVEPDEVLRRTHLGCGRDPVPAARATVFFHQASE
jgi:hypothetical protein